MSAFDQTAVKPDAADAGAEPADRTEKPKRGDKPPKKRGPGRPKGYKPPKATGAAFKAQSRTLERKLAELLAFPAVPAAMAYEHDPIGQLYMVDHFTRSGPRTAALLVEASETNDQLRALLVRITTGGSLLTVVVALAAYTGPPIMFAVLGMREQAAKLTAATTLTPEELQAMMAADAAAAQSAATQDNGATGPDGAPLTPEPDPGAG